MYHFKCQSVKTIINDILAVKYFFTHAFTGIPFKNS